MTMSATRRATAMARVAGDLARHVGAFHDQAQLPGQGARIGGARAASARSLHDVLDRLLVRGRGHVRRLVRQRKLHRHVHEDAALVLVVLDDLLHHVEQRPELVRRRAAPPRSSHHLAEGVLQPAVLLLQHRQHQVVLAPEVLVEGGLADAHVGQHLVEADVAEAVAVEAARGGIDQSLVGAGPSSESSGALEVNPRCTTSQLSRTRSRGSHSASSAPATFEGARRTEWRCPMKRWIFLAYGVSCHLLFLATFA